MNTHQFASLKDKIRLSKKNFQIICSAFEKTFEAQDELWLFGSRADLNARGGDIDLLIKTTINNAEKAGLARRNFLNNIFLQLEEQKIDVVVLYSGQEILPIHTIAQKTGVRLL